MDAFASKLSPAVVAVEAEPVKIDGEKLEAEITACQDQIARQTAEIAVIERNAANQEAEVQAWIEAEVQKAADEKRTQLQEEWAQKVASAKAGAEQGIASCEARIAENQALLAEEIVK